MDANEKDGALRVVKADPADRLDQLRQRMQGRVAELQEYEGRILAELNATIGRRLEVQDWLAALDAGDVLVATPAGGNGDGPGQED